MTSDTDDVQPAYMAVPEEEVSIAIHPYTGPKHRGIDIDIFLEPLMQEMETLWKEGPFHVQYKETSLEERSITMQI